MAEEDQNQKYSVSDPKFMKTKTYPLVVYSTDSSGDIVYAEFRSSINVDLAKAMEIVSSRLDFTHNEKHYLVGDVSKVKQVSSEAKAFFQRKDGGLKNILAAALVASNPLSALIANIFIKTPKDFNAKFFWNKKEAVNWIQHQRLKESNKMVSLNIRKNSNLK